MENEKLLPCPFCGGKAKLVKSKSKMADIRIQCTKCGIKTGWWMGELVELIGSWNTRVYPKEVQDAIDFRKPRKPKDCKKKNGFTSGLCQSCGAIVDLGNHFCRICGQKQDWSE